MQTPTRPDRAFCTLSPGPASAAGPSVSPRANPVLVEPVLEHAPLRRSTVLLLCLFLGWLGVHRFYLGKRTTGRVYLLTGGLFFAGVIVDLILILLGALEDEFGRPIA
jgi:hypothetical protein